MKILHVVECFNAGVGRHVVDLCEGQAAQDHEITLAWSPVRAEPPLVDRMKAIPGIRWVTLDMHRSLGSHDLRSVAGLRKIVAQLGPFDVLHGHGSKGGAFVRLLPRRIGGLRVYTPNAFRTQDPELGSLAKRFYGTLERVLARRTDLIIAVSRDEVAHARELSIEAGILSLVTNGIVPETATTRAAARRAMGLKEDEIAVGFVGRFTHQKYPERFVQAVGLAGARCPRIVGVMLGDGELRRNCEELAKGNRIRFLGWQNGPALIKGFDIFCMTSRYEGFPYTLLEAIHAGVPIITTDVGGAGEAVNSGETGLILPREADAAQISAALAELAEDEEKRTAWSDASLKVAGEHSLARMVDKTLLAYEEARAARERR
jgi:glycosyltransferase involved in cell wall biosynthesis